MAGHRGTNLKSLKHEEGESPEVRRTHSIRTSPKRRSEKLRQPS